MVSFPAPVMLPGLLCSSSSTPCYLRLQHLQLLLPLRGEHAPIYINGTEVERVNSIKFVDLFWTSHVNVTVKKAQQHLFFLRWLRKFGMSITSLINFYRCTIESILSGCKTAWYGNCSAQNCKKLQKVVCTAQTIMEANLPSAYSIYMAHCHGKAANIIKDPLHPGNDLPQPLLSGRRFRSLNAHQKVKEQLLSGHFQTVEWTLASNHVTCNVICMPLSLFDLYILCLL
ncbi:uncharacterized protein LOC132209491 [Stegostoma tigrinum]|uniref:uncharacterized protein LOC132209491 n=1 Tax=Stegostoma tigrinum TaxID=3053191 RepID=UPI00287035FE|nr:uncharacterized protein LOC132209491 [Stegostoma tigrinum]